MQNPWDGGRTEFASVVLLRTDEGLFWMVCGSSSWERIPSLAKITRS